MDNISAFGSKMLESLLESYWLFPLVLFAFVLLLYSYVTAIPKYSFSGKHVAITGNLYFY